MSNLPFHPKYGYFDLDSITGFDACCLSLAYFRYDGFFLQSPLDAYMLKKFKFKPTLNPIEKPFKARWMVSERQLQMGFVNGILNGKTIFTNEIYPNFPDDDILHPIRFNGSLDFIVLTSSSNTDPENGEFHFPNDHFKLTFSGGVLIRKECILTN